MSKSLSILLILTLSLGTSAWIVCEDLVAQDVGGARRPLDVPSGGLGGDDEEEDNPEIITFYGSEYEGEAFFWCLDRSCSMGWAGGAPLATLKSEMTQAINQLSSQADFGMVSFHTGFQTWNTLPQRATPVTKGAAIAWINNMTATGTTCITPAALQTLQIAQFSTKKTKRMILVGDGVPECPPPPSQDQNEQTLQEITGANFQSIPIDTVFISASAAGIQLFQDIAAANGGTFINPQ